jgi:hypothetical protein
MKPFVKDYTLVENVIGAPKMQNKIEKVITLNLFASFFYRFRTLGFCFFFITLSIRISLFVCTFLLSKTIAKNKGKLIAIANNSK